MQSKYPIGAVICTVLILAASTLFVIGASVKPAYEVGGKLSAQQLGLDTNALGVTHGVFEVINGTNLVYIDQSVSPNITNSLDVDTGT